MRIWFDTEFIEDGRTIDLISIGMVREDGATYYAESADCDKSRASDWVVQNVFPHLRGPVKHRAQIAKELVDFAGHSPEFWADYCSYDWVVLCQLFGTMMELPKGWPMHCRDIRQLWADKGCPDLPVHDGTAHDALSDALGARHDWQYLNQCRRK